MRAHAGQSRAPSTCAALLAGSEIVESHVNCAKVQDPYSLRCMPQVHGAARDGIAFARRILEVEVNSATDNPLVFVETERDRLRRQLPRPAGGARARRAGDGGDELANISERRVEQLVNP